MLCEFILNLEKRTYFLHSLSLTIHIHLVPLLLFFPLSKSLYNGEFSMIYISMLLFLLIFSHFPKSLYSSGLSQLLQSPISTDITQTVLTFRISCPQHLLFDTFLTNSFLYNKFSFLFDHWFFGSNKKV